MPNTFELIASSTVGAGGTTAFDFTSIPSTYTDLVLKVSSRTAKSTSNFDYLNVKFNNVSTNQTYKSVIGNGASTDWDNSTTINLITVSNAMTASTFGSIEMYIPNYAGSNYKSVSIDAVNEQNATTAYVNLAAGLWSSTAAINQITLTPASATNIVQYSTAYLYGVKNA